RRPHSMLPTENSEEDMKKTSVGQDGVWSTLGWVKLEETNNLTIDATTQDEPKRDDCRASIAPAHLSQVLSNKIVGRRQKWKVKDTCDSFECRVVVFRTILPLMSRDEKLHESLIIQGNYYATEPSLYCMDSHFTFNFSILLHMSKYIDIRGTLPRCPCCCSDVRIG
ncbi:hypothetical protein L9F63_014518, partial [Diploptera punctata]